MDKSLVFIWPPESYGPTSLFKHFTYLGESASYAKKFGRVKIIDLSVDHPTRYELERTIYDADLVFMPVELYTARRAVKLTKFIKQISKAKVFAYGTLPAINPKIITPYFDAVIRGESFEKALDNLFASPKQFSRKIHRGVYSIDESLSGDEWAFPALELLPLEKYFRISPNQLELRVQRGCPYNCTFCAEKYRTPGKKVYHRTSTKIAQFMEENPNHTFYLDAATFTFDKDWTLGTCHELSKLSPIKKWRTITRIDKLDKDTIQALSRAGCYKIGFGVETLNKDTQKSIRKIVNEEDIAKVTGIMRNHGIIPRAFFILGLPGQVKSDVDYAIDFAHRIKIEYRWKEYLPIQNALTVPSVEQCEQFERDCLLEHNIAGLSKKEYVKLLNIER